jgi:hypothetical protein
VYGRFDSVNRLHQTGSAGLPQSRVTLGSNSGT